jgi:hypothetical protein
MPTPFARSVLLAVLVSGPLAAQQTWVVDDDGGAGVDFTSLPAAVTAAGRSDILLVRPGVYAPFAVTGKSIHIFGSGPDATLITGTWSATPGVTIADVPAGKTFNLSGVKISISASGLNGSTTGAQLTISGTSGSTVLQDVVGVPAFGLGGSIAGLRVLNADVHATRCTFRGSTYVQIGGITGPGSVHGTHGAHVLGAAFVAESCVFEGGDATIPCGSFIPSVVAGHGLVHNAAAGRLSACVIEGGSADGDQLCGGGDGAATGGDGLIASGALRIDADVVIHGGHAEGFPQTQGRGLVSGPGVQIHGSPDIAPGAGVNTPFTAPPPVAIVGSPVTGLPPLPRLVTSGAPVNGGELSAVAPALLSLTSELPQTPFFLLLDIRSSFQSTFALPLLGEVLLSTGAGFVFGGVTDAVGAFQLAFTLNSLAPGAANAPLHVQALVYDFAAGVYRTSNEEIRIFRN